MKRLAQVLPFALVIAVLAGLTFSSFRSSRAATDIAARQRIDDAANTTRLLAEQFANNYAPDDSSGGPNEQIAKIFGVDSSSSPTELRQALNKWREASGIAEQSMGLLGEKSELIAASQGWNDELTVAAKAVSGESDSEADFTVSDVVPSKTGPRILTSVLVKGWGSAKTRTVMIANPLNSFVVPGADELRGGGTFLMVDGEGTVVYATDPQLTGIKLPWWDQHKGSLADGDSRTISIGDVRNHVTAYQIPQMPWTMAFMEPESEFFASKDTNKRLELTIIVLAGLMAALLAALVFKRHQDSRRSERRLNALLEDVGDAVLEVRDGKIAYASPASKQFALDDQPVVGRSLADAFGEGILGGVDVVPGEEIRFDTQLPRQDGSSQWLEVAMVDRSTHRDVRALVVSLHDVTERQELQAELFEQATHDVLTGLVTRRQFSILVDNGLAGARRTGQQIALLYLDLDGFKLVNDEHGHEAGDMLLQACSGRLKECVRENDVVARLGGDEFAIMLNDVTTSHTEEVIDRIQTRISAPITISPTQDVTVGVSVGVAYAVEGAGDIASLLRTADAEMYQCKEARHLAAAATTA